MALGPPGEGEGGTSRCEEDVLVSLPTLSEKSSNIFNYSR